MRPVVSTFTEELYTRLGYQTQEDEANGWHLLHYLQSFGQSAQPVEDLVRDTDEALGWTAITDIERVPTFGIAWLAQCVGVRLLSGLDDTTQRDRTKATDGFKRGTPAALLGAARASLTGTKGARLEERFGGNPWRMRLVTYTTETPNPTLTCQLAQEAKAGGNILTCVVFDGQNWDQLRDGAGGRTWAEVDAEFADWDAVRNNLP